MAFFLFAPAYTKGLDLIFCALINAEETNHLRKLYYIRQPATAL